MCVCVCACVRVYVDLGIDFAVITMISSLFNVGSIIVIKNHVNYLLTSTCSTKTKVPAYFWITKPCIA